MAIQSSYETDIQHKDCRAPVVCQRELDIQ